MSDSKQAPPLDERIHRLERRANAIRARLFRAVDALDIRGHQVAKIGQQAKHVALPAALSLLGIAVLFGASAFLLSRGVKQRRRRSLGDRFSHAVQRLDLVRQPTLGRRVFDKVTLTFVAFAATELTRHLSKNVLEERSSH